MTANIKNLCRSLVFITLAVFVLPADAGFDAGKEAYEQENYKKAWKEFFQSVKDEEDGFEHSLVYLADLYEHGKGVKKDIQLAEELYREAIQRGNEYAERRLEIIAKKNRLKGDENSETLGGWIQSDKFWKYLTLLVLGIFAVTFIVFFVVYGESSEDRYSRKLKEKKEEQKQIEREKARIKKGERGTKKEKQKQIKREKDKVKKEKPKTKDEQAVHFFLEMLKTTAEENSGTPYQIEEVLFQWFIIDFAVSAKLENNRSAKNNLLDSFYARALKWFIDDLHESADLVTERMCDYGAAYHEEIIGRDGEDLGPVWSIGKKYSEVVGGDFDVAIIMKAGMLWAGKIKIIDNLMSDIGY